MEISMNKEELEAMMTHAAKKGAQEALANLGLDDENAEQNIRDLRQFIKSLNAIRESALRAVVNGIINGLLIAFVLGVGAFFVLNSGKAP
jgi:predicted PurR-regulated permease PerM